MLVISFTGRVSAGKEFWERVFQFVKNLVAQLLVKAGVVSVQETWLINVYGKILASTTVFDVSL